MQFTLTQLATQVIETSVTVSNIPQGNTRHCLLLKREFDPFFQYQFMVVIPITGNGSS